MVTLISNESECRNTVVGVIILPIHLIKLDGSIEEMMESVVPTVCLTQKCSQTKEDNNNNNTMSVIVTTIKANAVDGKNFN